MDGELHELLKKISILKEKGYLLFGKYQASNMGTQKRHPLDHAVQSLQETGDIDYVHKVCLTGLINTLKNATGKLHVGNATAIEDLIERRAVARAQKKHMHYIGATSTTCTTLKTQLLILNNKAILSKAKRSATIPNLELFLEKILNRTQGFSSIADSSNKKTDIFESIGEDDTRALCVLLKQHM